MMQRNMEVVMGKASQFVHLFKAVMPLVRDVKKALEAGADINEQTGTNGYTPLMYAVEGQYDRVAEYLLRQGADPLVKNYEGKIASELIADHCSVYHILKGFELLSATNNNDLEPIKLLIHSGVPVNFQGTGGYTALIIAVEQHNITLIEYLLSQGADPNLTRSDGLSVFDIISDSKIKQLLEQAKTANGTYNNESQKKYKNINNFFARTIPNIILEQGVE